MDDKMRSESRHGQFHRFMDLPAEIRDLIYSYVLCKDKVIVPNSHGQRAVISPVRVEHYETNDGACYLRYQGLEKELRSGPSRPMSNPIGLIQGVSKQVHDEATRIFFGRNQFIFPAGAFASPAYCNLLDSVGRSTESDFIRDARKRTNNALLLRDVSYTFDMRDHPEDDYANLYKSFLIKESIDSRELSRGEALQALHNQKNTMLGINWTERIDCIKHMTLDRLILAFEECYCTIGCCRKVEWVLDRLLHAGPPPATGDPENNAYSLIDWSSRPPLVVEVMGFVSDDERAMALEKLESLRGSEIRFIPDLRSRDNFLDDSG